MRTNPDKAGPIVGALRDAGHELVDDLDEGDSGPVVVDDRVSSVVDAAARSTDVGDLARVLFDVGPFDDSQVGDDQLVKHDPARTDDAQLGGRGGFPSSGTEPDAPPPAR